jgi:hypothetical protein
MKLYSSRVPNTDPMPWTDFYGTRYAYPFSSRPIVDLARDERPEFDHVPVATEGANPLILEFREFSGIAEMWVKALDDESFIAETGYAYQTQIDDSQVDHARRVLTRLAALEA